MRQHSYRCCRCATRVQSHGARRLSSRRVPSRSASRRRESRSGSRIATLLLFVSCGFLQASSACGEEARSATSDSTITLKVPTLKATDERAPRTLPQATPALRILPQAQPLPPLSETAPRTVILPPAAPLQKVNYLGNGQAAAVRIMSADTREQPAEAGPVRVVNGPLPSAAASQPAAQLPAGWTAQLPTESPPAAADSLPLTPPQPVADTTGPQLVNPISEYPLAAPSAELTSLPAETMPVATLPVATLPAEMVPAEVPPMVTLPSQPVAYQPDGVDGGDLFEADDRFAPNDGAADQLAPRQLPDVPVEIQQRPNQIGRGMPFEVVTSSGELQVTRRRNKILRSEHDIYRAAVVDPEICDIVQFTPREVSIIGRAQGATNVTFWFADGSHKPVTYLVRVVPDPEVQVERERQYQILEEVVAELFPDSKVRLLPVADKLIVRGQAKGAEEAAQIMAVIRGEAVQGANGNGNNGSVVDGQAAAPLSDEETGLALPAANVINMLRIPGVQQVALKVKIAELNRSAAREFGVDLDATFNVGSSGSLMIQTLLNMASGSTTSISGTFDNDDINFGIHYLQSHDVVRILSEPTLVTLSGRPASFLAGGEFAVPTVVGVEGASAIATDFRSFGVILNFLPTVIDKDRIRLQISPEFSQIDNDLEVDGTPGLNTRAVTTTVEMREGQAFAIAGLLEDSMSSDTVSDLPILPRLLGQRSVSHNETELLILVTPELVHPLEPEEVPPLPGFDVTEPTNKEFFFHGDIEGRPTREYRSTIWPRLRSRYRNGGPAMISGPFGHGQ